MSTHHLQENIELIVKHEQDFLNRRTRAERLGDAVAGWMGSLKFVAFHITLLAVWVGANSWPGLRFDAFPYPVLDLIFAFEAIILASFVLMRQSRISRRVDERNHLELQVLLLTEKEITAVLSVCRGMAQQMGLKAMAKDTEIEQLSQKTPIDEVAESIRENLGVSDRLSPGKVCAGRQNKSEAAKCSAHT